MHGQENIGVMVLSLQSRREAENHVRPENAELHLVTEPNRYEKPRPNMVERAQRLLLNQAVCPCQCFLTSSSVIGLRLAFAEIAGLTLSPLYPA